MKNFTGNRDGDRREGGFRGGDRGGKPSFQKREWTNDRPAQMHKATCAECGKSCDVPFRPTGDKPVYCNDCFGKKRDGGDARPSRDYGAPKSFPQRDFGDRFAPRSAYVDRSDSRPAFKPASDNSGKQLAEISQKLDRLIIAMEKMTTSISTPSPKKEIPELAIFKASKPKAPKKAEAKKKKVVAKKKK